MEHIEHLLEYNLPVPTPTRVLTSYTIKKEHFVQREIPAVNVAGDDVSYEDYLTTVVQPDSRELVYSGTPSTAVNIAVKSPA